jgi:hypothetical protein
MLVVPVGAMYTPEAFVEPPVRALSAEVTAASIGGYKRTAAPHPDVLLTVSVRAVEK